jgi:heme/copper-type cytochrome/quinol oxidase subunit 4
MKRKHLYLVLTVLGICYTWYYNIQYFQTAEDPSLINFFKEAQSNFAGKSFGADLSVVVLTFFAFMIPESLKLKIKYWWILIPLTFLIAIAFTFPLFLYMRENTLERLKLSS